MILFLHRVLSVVVGSRCIPTKLKREGVTHVIRHTCTGPLETSEMLHYPDEHSGTAELRKGFSHGIRTLELPVIIKNGPQTIIQLKSNVTSPEVVLSAEEMDFDSVLIGQTKTKYLQVSDNGPVSSMVLIAGDPPSSLVEYTLTGVRRCRENTLWHTRNTVLEHP